MHSYLSHICTAQTPPAQYRAIHNGRRHMHRVRMRRVEKARILTPIFPPPPWRARDGGWGGRGDHSGRYQQDVEEGQVANHVARRRALAGRRIRHHRQRFRAGRYRDFQASPPRRLTALRAMRLYEGLAIARKPPSSSTHTLAAPLN